jgi:hypothetical protein
VVSNVRAQSVLDFESQGCPIFGVAVGALQDILVFVLVPEKEFAKIIMC